MELGEFFDLAVEKGIEVDVRGRERIFALLKDLRREYEAMDEEAKVSFDTERLKNPFGDTRILYGPRDGEIKTFLTASTSTSVTSSTPRPCAGGARGSTSSFPITPQ